MRTSWVDTGQAVLTASTMAAWVAIPDYTSTRRGRFAAKTLLTAAAAGGVLLADRLRDERSQRSSEPESQRPSVHALLTERFDEPKANAIFGGLVASSALFTTFGTRIMRGTAAALERRGVKRPWTKIGLVAGAVSLAGDTGLARRALEKVR